MRSEYKHRVVDETLDFHLECMGGVLIEGPKWCGKTRTGDVNLMGHPSFLMVLTGTDLEYTREDGVVICPLGCLRP